MAEKKLSPIEQWYEVCKKKGRFYTSEEHRARGFEYMKPYYNRAKLPSIPSNIGWTASVISIRYTAAVIMLQKPNISAYPPRRTIFTVLPMAQYPDDWPAGISGFYSGSDNEWFRPMCEGGQDQLSGNKIPVRCQTDGE